MQNYSADFPLQIHVRLVKFHEKLRPNIKVKVKRKSAIQIKPNAITIQKAIKQSNFYKKNMTEYNAFCINIKNFWIKNFKIHIIPIIIDQLCQTR